MHWQSCSMYWKMFLSTLVNGVHLSNDHGIEKKCPCQPLSMVCTCQIIIIVIEPWFMQKAKSSTAQCWHFRKMQQQANRIKRIFTFSQKHVVASSSQLLSHSSQEFMKGNWSAVHWKSVSRACFLSFSFFHLFTSFCPRISPTAWVKSLERIRRLHACLGHGPERESDILRWSLSALLARFSWLAKIDQWTGSRWSLSVSAVGPCWELLWRFVVLAWWIWQQEQLPSSAKLQFG